ncbi:cellulase [Streptomyces sp. NPDC016626]|uniref:cellulase n=1 Tax=Streptomyces sp. NPDC016626 TaxID=3364968 RepID=UPI0036FC3A77
MDDFERELTRLMRESRARNPFGPEHQRRLYQGIRARRRARMLWRAGGSALAVTGLGVGLALLPVTGSGSRPADHRPLPATSPTPSASPAPTTSAPDTSRPPTDASTSTGGATTAPGSGGAPSPTRSPSATPGAGSRTTWTPPTPPVSSTPPTATPPTETARGPSAPADDTSAGSG